MKKILFITSNRLGDGAISTSVMNYIIEQNPDCKMTVACGWLVKGISEQFENVEKVIVLEKKKHHKHWLELWLQVFGTRWDMVVDIRNCIVSRLVFAKEKHIWSKGNPELHKVEQLREFIGAKEPIAPKIVFKQETLDKASEFIKDGEKAFAIGPTSNWAPKTWAPENFIEFVKRMFDEYDYDKVAVIAAKGEEDVAYEVFNHIDPDKRVDVIAKADPEVSIAVISKCNFFLGHDSGLMHSSYAAGTPTIGMYGPSEPLNYGPWGEHTAYVMTPKRYTKEELDPLRGTHEETKHLPSLMTTLTVDMVFDATKKLLEKVSSNKSS